MKITFKDSILVQVKTLEYNLRELMLESEKSGQDQSSEVRKVLSDFAGEDIYEVRLINSHGLILGTSNSKQSRDRWTKINRKNCESGYCLAKSTGPDLFRPAHWKQIMGSYVTDKLEWSNHWVCLFSFQNRNSLSEYAGDK